MRSTDGADIGSEYRYTRWQMNEDMPSRRNQKTIELLKDTEVKRWYERKIPRSYESARVRLSNLANFCEATGLMPDRVIYCYTYARNVYSSIDIDLLIVMDTTGSMENNINSAKIRAKAILDEFQTDKDVDTLRAGFISYRDYGDEPVSYLTSTHPLTTDLTALQNFINNLDLGDGQDICEAWDSAAQEINSVFRSGTERAGRIVVWITDAPPHGRQYNCGLGDTQPPRVDLKTEIEEALGNDTHFYFMLYPPMSERLSCVRKYLKPWGEILPLGDGARGSSADDIKTILHHGVLQAIARREIRDGLEKGKSKEEIIDGLIASKLPSRNLDLDGDRITTSDSDMTRGGAEGLIDKAIRFNKPKKAKDIADRILKGKRDDGEYGGGSDWLLPFIESLGDDVRDSRTENGIQYVDSYQSPIPGVSTNRQNRAWWALDERLLDDMTEKEFLDFLLEVGLTKVGKKTICITNCNGSKPIAPLRKEALKVLSKTNVIELNGGGISPVPIPSIPRPWPWPVTPPGPYDPDGEGDFNCVPGIAKGDCKPFLLVIPEVDCNKMESSDYTYSFDCDEGHNFWHCDENHDWRPHEIDDYDDRHTDDPDRPSPPNPDEVWGRMRPCFCRILESAIHHATGCLRKSNGEMNRTIIVQMSRNGIDMGLLEHPCYKCFVAAVGRLNNYWRPRGEWGGVELLVQIIE